MQDDAVEAGLTTSRIRQGEAENRRLAAMCEVKLRHSKFCLSAIDDWLELLQIPQPEETWKKDDRGDTLDQA